MRSFRTALLIAILAAPVLAPVLPPIFSQAHAGEAPADKYAMERVEQHIQDLHKRLEITPAEEAPWAVFADTMRQNAVAMEQSYKDWQSRAPSMNALDEMRSYAAAVRLHADSVNRLVPAFEALYGAMTPAQRILADKIFAELQRASLHPGRA